MKLKNILEVSIPMDGESPFDDMVSRDQEDSMPRLKDRRMQDRERKPRTPSRNSNVNKAKRIRNAVQTLKRERSNVEKVPDDVAIDNGETPSQSSLGGHSSMNFSK